MSKRPLVVACVANRYLFRGGEEEAFEAEIGLLEQNGVRVVPVVARTPAPATARQNARLGLETVWSRRWYRTMSRLIERHSVDILHVHNSFPVFSPSIYYAARKAGVPVVQTLHNYRLVCPSAILYRDGHTCEDCIGRPPLPAVIHRCYHDSVARTGAISAMLVAHRLLRTWSHAVDAYVALTRFARERFVAGGLPEDKVVVKPNFVDPDPGAGSRDGDFALYVGRLSREKGVGAMLDAWSDLEVPLRILGDGPLEPAVRQAASSSRFVTYLGRRPRSDVLSQMQRARLLIFPSELYEGFPMTLVEAFATGLPVLTAGHGSMAEIVEDGRTGIWFEKASPQDLRRSVRTAWDDPARLNALGSAARREYLARYTAKENFRLLSALYERVLDGFRRPV